jgi:hypothetical protein
MKTKLQRLQSRISKRRNAIHAVDNRIWDLLEIKKLLVVLPTELKAELTALRDGVKMLGLDQKLDKELYQMLLELAVIDGWTSAHHTHQLHSSLVPFGTHHEGRVDKDHPSDVVERLGCCHVF